MHSEDTKKAKCYHFWRELNESKSNFSSTVVVFIHIHASVFVHSALNVKGCCTYPHFCDKILVTQRNNVNTLCLQSNVTTICSKCQYFNRTAKTLIHL